MKVQVLLCPIFDIHDFFYQYISRNIRTRTFGHVHPGKIHAV